MARHRCPKSTDCYSYVLHCRSVCLGQSVPAGAWLGEIDPQDALTLRPHGPLQEISALAGCRCPNITDYYGSVLRHGSTELMIIMELMTCSVADLVRVG